MGLAVLYSRGLAGMDAALVTVEVHLANGLPNFTIVGLPEAEVKESKDRVRAALQNCQFEFPARRITVNLAPADLPKESGRFDLPIALGILAASGQIPSDKLAEYEYAGELALTGEIRAIRGALAMTYRAANSGRAFILPAVNAPEAALVEDATVYPAQSLLQVAAHLSGRDALTRYIPDTKTVEPHYPDMREVKGQAQSKRALEIAAAGIRIVECIHDLIQPVELKSMFFTPGVLAGRTLQRLFFDKCHFQPTGIVNSTLNELEFQDCEFERLEINVNQQLSGCTFINCKIESFILAPDGEPTFDPILIEEHLSALGANITDGKQAVFVEYETNTDDRLQKLERFLRIFLRTTSVGDGVILLRLGTLARSFIDDVLPVLLESNIVEEVPWMGQGMHHRYKLARPMSEISTAMEQSQGSFNGFLAAIKRNA